MPAQGISRTVGQALSGQYDKGAEQQIAANQAIDRQRQSYANTNTGPAGQNIKAGLLDAALQQAQMGAAQQKLNENEMADWKRLGLLSSALNSFACQYGTTRATGTGQSATKANQFAAPLGVAPSALAAQH